MNETAFPYQFNFPAGSGEEYGLSKLEYVSTAIIQGLLSNSKRWATDEAQVKQAVSMAKRLLAECHMVENEKR